MQNVKQSMSHLQLKENNLSPGIPSTLSITSDPSNIAIYINEKYIGNTPCKPEIKWSEFDNNIIIVGRKSGYRDGTKSIRNGDSSPINFVLQKDE